MTTYVYGSVGLERGYIKFENKNNFGKRYPVKSDMWAKL